MNIVGRRKIFYAISGSMIAVSILAMALWQFRLGIDFAGGTLWEIGFPGSASISHSDIEAALKDAGIDSASIQDADERTFVIRFREINETAHQNLISLFMEKWPSTNERRFETVGPTIGKTLRQKAVTSVLAVLFVISIYVAWAFRGVSKPISSWKYGAVTVATLLHDVMVPLGLFAILGRFSGVEIDSSFIVALLVVMGFSVHDTIVVFDRIRENLRKSFAGGEEFASIVNRSVNETLVRSINTSLTTLLVLAALYIWGGITLKYFVLALMAGIFVGTYSSIFIASPLLVDWAARASRKTRE